MQMMYQMNNNNMNQFNQMNNNMNQMNQFNQMNINMNQKKNEIKHFYLTLKVIVKPKDCMIKIQCKSDEKIKEAINKFKCKLCDDSKQFFFYTREKIINYEQRLDQYGINDEEEIIAVEKNDK